MAKSILLAHWSKQSDNFTASAQEFYAAVQDGLGAREIPGVKTKKVVWKESGILSAGREYLRVQREHLRFDLCAAPFGRGFFFSWWQTDERRFGWLYLIGFLLLTTIAVVAHFLRPECYFHHARFWKMVPVLVAGMFLVLGAGVRLGLLGRSHDATGAPLIGSLYARVFAPMTYFAHDTTQMYQTIFHSAVLEAIDALTTAKGVRALTDDERKPVMRDLFK